MVSTNRRHLLDLLEAFQHNTDTWSYNFCGITMKRGVTRWWGNQGCMHSMATLCLADKLYPSYADGNQHHTPVCWLSDSGG